MDDLDYDVKKMKYSNEMITIQNEVIAYTIFIILTNAVVGSEIKDGILFKIAMILIAVRICLRSFQWGRYKFKLKKLEDKKE